MISTKGIESQWRALGILFTALAVFLIACTETASDPAAKLLASVSTISEDGSECGDESLDCDSAAIESQDVGPEVAVAASIIELPIEGATALSTGTGGSLLIGYSSGLIQRVAADGSFAEVHVLPGPCRAIAETGTGVIYAALDEIVTQINGEEIREWTRLGENSRISSVSASNATILVADSGIGKIWIYSPDGTLENLITTNFKFPGNNFDVSLLISYDVNDLPSLGCTKPPMPRPFSFLAA